MIRPFVFIITFFSSVFASEYRQDFWKRWFDNNKNNYVQSEINNFYDYYTQTKYQYINGNDTLKFLEYVSQFSNDTLSTSQYELFWKSWFSNNKSKYSEAEIKEFSDFYKTTKYDYYSSRDTIDFINHVKKFDSLRQRELLNNNFWERWFSNNKMKYSQYEINLISRRLKDIQDTIQFLKYVMGIDSIKEQYHQAEISDSINYRKFVVKNKLVLKNFKHVVDKFGQYDFWRYSNIFSSGNYSIDLIVSNQNKMYFFVNYSKRSCMNDDAHLVFLLENGETVNLFSVSNFNCSAYFSTHDIEDGEFNSPVKAIRIDHGSRVNGMYDFSVSKEKGKMIKDILNNPSKVLKTILK